MVDFEIKEVYTEEQGEIIFGKLPKLFTLALMEIYANNMGKNATSAAEVYNFVASDPKGQGCKEEMDKMLAGKAVQ